MKKEGLFIKVILLITVLLASACAKQEGTYYFPMSDGARWEYSSKTCREGNCKKGTMISLIDGEETINGKKYYKMVTVVGEALEQTINHNRKTKEGVYRISGKHKDKPEQLVLPFPFMVGKMWTYQPYEPFLATNEMRVAGKETLFLDDKKYENCFKISLTSVVEKGEWKGVEILGTVYYAPNIGMVKQILRFPSSATQELTLNKYEP